MFEVLVLATTISILGDAMAGEPPSDTHHIRFFPTGRTALENLMVGFQDLEVNGQAISEKRGPTVLDEVKKRLKESHITFKIVSETLTR